MTLVPKENITDFRTVPITGGAFTEKDGYGGFRIVADGLGGRGIRSGSVYGPTQETAFSFIWIGKTFAIAAGTGQIFGEDAGGGGGNRKHLYKVRVDGEISALNFDEGDVTWLTESNQEPFDDGEEYIFCSVVDSTSSLIYRQKTKDPGAQIVLVEALPYDVASSGSFVRLDVNVGIPLTFLASHGGSAAMPAGTYVAQWNAFTGKGTVPELQAQVDRVLAQIDDEGIIPPIVQRISPRISDKIIT